MDYKDDLYPKIPFYMAYPMQSMYLTEMEYEKDMDLMKTYYPSETKAIMKLVEDRLDELAYEGSRIYDEEPDRWMIQMEIDRLYQKLIEENPEELSGAIPQAEVSGRQSYFDMVPMSISGGRMAAQEHRGGCQDNWLCSMVGVLFGTELYRRRCRHRRCKRWW